jgi:ABC-type nickel/cobalt efflux system permease component RcnA
MSLIGAFSEGGFRLGLLVAAFWFGFRHGIDWDHIAAITDITSSQEERRQSVIFGTLYALGHALVVLVLGILAILVGEQLPAGVDDVMTRIVGATLILLGVYVFVSLIRHGRDFRLRSRWMLVFAGVRKGVRWAKRRTRSGAEGQASGVESEPANALVAQADVEAPSWHHGHHGRPGHHHHSRPEPDDTFMTYGRATAFGVGMIHGVGAETPTQVLIFLSAAGAGGTGVGVLVLLSFIVGLLASNTMITLGSAFGYLRASKNFPIYAGVAIVTGVFSLVIGALFLFGRTTLLPALFGG